MKVLAGIDGQLVHVEGQAFYNLISFYGTAGKMAGCVFLLGNKISIIWEMQVLRAAYTEKIGN